MKVNILFFGIAAELAETTTLEIEVVTAMTIAEFKLFLVEKYPQLTSLNTYAIAVNEVYATPDFILSLNDVVAILPPVSGG